MCRFAAEQVIYSIMIVIGIVHNLIQYMISWVLLCNLQEIKSEIASTVTERKGQKQSIINATHIERFQHVIIMT